MKTIIAPSYGTVIQVTTEGPYIHIATFLAVWDNHDQFIPYTGTCVDSIYKQGTFDFAHMLGKSDKNERWTTIFKTDIGRIAVTQIAGLVAKRIVNHCHIGQAYSQGAIYGEILLGSRVDITFPALPGMEMNIKKGDRLTGGKTIIAAFEPAKMLPEAV